MKSGDKYRHRFVVIVNRLTALRNVSKQDMLIFLIAMRHKLPFVSIAKDKPDVVVSAGDSQSVNNLAGPIS